MVQISKEQGICFAVGVVIVVAVISIIAATNVSTYKEGNQGTNQTRTDIVGCEPWQTREISRDSAGIKFTCKNKEGYVGLGGGGPRVCNYNQTTEVRGLPNGAGLLACADKPGRPLQDTTRKTVTGAESFVNVGLVPGYNCTFKKTSPGADAQFGSQYTCLPVKVDVASRSATGHQRGQWGAALQRQLAKDELEKQIAAANAANEGYSPKAYSFKTHSRANFMGTNYRRNNFVPNLKNRVNFLGTDYRKRENLNGSMSSGATVPQPTGNNRTPGCGPNQSMVAIRRGPDANLDMTCETIQ
jgi:hypothetical protein